MKQVDKNSRLFHKLYVQSNSVQNIEQVRNFERRPQKYSKPTNNSGRICYRCGGHHEDKSSYDNCYAAKLQCNFCKIIGHISKICCAKRKSTSKANPDNAQTDTTNVIPYLEF